MIRCIYFWTVLHLRLWHLLMSMVPRITCGFSLVYYGLLSANLHCAMLSRVSLAISMWWIFSKAIRKLRSSLALKTWHTARRIMLPRFFFSGLFCRGFWKVYVAVRSRLRCLATHLWWSCVLWRLHLPLCCMLLLYSVCSCWNNCAESVVKMYLFFVLWCARPSYGCKITRVPSLFKTGCQVPLLVSVLSCMFGRQPMLLLRHWHSLLMLLSMKAGRFQTAVYQLNCPFGTVCISC